MAQDVLIAGALFPDVPQIKVPDGNGAYHPFCDPSVTTAGAADVAEGKIFLAADGTPTEGTASGGSAVIQPLSVTQNGTYTAPSGVDGYSPVSVNVPSGSTQLTFGAIRPDAELVKTISYDKLLVADEGIEIPAYTTSKTTLKDSSVLDTVQFDFNSFNCYVTFRGLVTPIYSTDDMGKGRQLYFARATVYTIMQTPNFKVGSVNFTHTNDSLNLTLAKLAYCSSATSGGQTTTDYGASYSVASIVSHARSGNNIDVTLRNPAFQIRGNSTYYASTYWNATTDIRYQYILDVWLAPAESQLNYSGWAHKMLHDRIRDSFLNGGTLT